MPAAKSRRDMLERPIRRCTAELLAFFLVAYAISWTVALPLVAARRGWIAGPAPMWLHYLTALGPAASAFGVTAWCEGRAGLRALAARVTRWRVGRRWWAIALGSPLAALLATLVALRLLHGAWLDVRPLAEMPYLGHVGYLPAFVLWIATFGLGEEIGWRGFATARLRRHHGPIATTLLVVPGWALWHLPMFLYHPSFIEMGLGGGLGWLISLAFGAGFLTWLLDGTRGSALMCALWHGGFNFTVSSKTSPVVPAVISALVMAAVTILVLRAGLARRRR